MKERKTEFIIVRVTPTEKEGLIKKAGKNLSRFVRKILGFK